MLSEGTWWMYSESDPRWDRSGRGLVGMFSYRQQEQLRDELKETLGDPPDDLMFGYMKD